MSALPSYIKRREGSQKLAARAFNNISGNRGPHLSIKGNRFALVDASGERIPLDQLYADIVVVDANDHLSKLYFEGDYAEGEAKPPECFSDNGVAPSASASKPQSQTCANCPQNAWGSKINAKGNVVKACRDEQKLAFLMPDRGAMMFQLVVPPGSLKNWKNYTAKFLNADFDVFDVLTRITFVDGTNGVLNFTPAPNPWYSESMAALVERAMVDPQKDLLVGRLDRPRQGALAAPQQVVEPAEPVFPSAAPNGVGVHVPPVAQAAQPAPAEEKPKGRRGRPPANPPPAAAPFQPAPFGIGAGVAPNAELEAGIKDIFGN